MNFSGTEDLGGGLKASFFTEMQLGGRQDLTTAPAATATTTAVPVTTANPTGYTTTGTVPNQAKATGVWARNATVSLAGGFGTVTGGRIESSNTHENAKVAGASLNDGFDKSALAGAVSNFNTISYTTPELVPGLRASVSQLKSLNDKFAPATVTVSGNTITTVTAANAETTVNVIGATYAAGPLASGFAYKMVDSANTTKGKKTELFVTYDLGVAKVGAGYGKNSGTLYAGQKAAIILSAVAPVAPNFTLGADYITHKAGGTATTVDAKGFAVAANYSLSKRTKLNATVGKLEGTGLGNETQYRAGIFHNF